MQNPDRKKDMKNIQIEKTTAIGLARASDPASPSSQHRLVGQYPFGTRTSAGGG
jgi:hypothetical protein